MEKRMKKLLALSICTAMTIGLTACGGSQGADNTGSETSAETAAEDTTEAADATEEASEEATEETTEEATEETAEAGDEETYDFGGVTVKAFGSEWNNLDSEDLVYQEAKEAVEQKYNIKLEKAAMDGYDGYNDDDILIASVAAGEPAADIITLNPESLIPCYMSGILYDITDQLDDLKVGSIYTDAGTWQGKCYGVSYDNLGDSWVLVYDRDFLEEIGMEKTPTEMFMEGKWDYENFEAYLTEMKSKLPDGKYPIGNYPYHWAVMAAGANGTALTDNNGKVGLTDDATIEALEFYQKLENEGLAYPQSVTTNADGEKELDTAYAVDDDRIVLKRVESWQLAGLEFNYGICFWPWGSNVTCDGDYTTLSDNYKVSTSYWGVDCVVAASADTTGIPGDVLTKIAYDYRNLVCEGGLGYMRDAYDAEQEGNFTVYGKEYGETRSFYTQEDIELYDWGHSRFQADLSWCMDKAELVKTWDAVQDVLAEFKDARSTMESYANEGEANLKDAGF